jgi:hypothetical protein
VLRGKKRGERKGASHQKEKEKKRCQPPNLVYLDKMENGQRTSFTALLSVVHAAEASIRV